MQKFLVGAIALTLLFPALAKAQEPDAPCYMVSSSGRMTNLGSLCGNTDSGNSAIPSAPAATPVATPPGRLIKIGESGGVPVFLNQDSLKRTGKGFSFEAMAIGQTGTTKLQFSLDCSTRNYTLDRVTAYDSKGQLIATQTTQWNLNTKTAEMEQSITVACQRLSTAPGF